jgi:hypothetical protein
MATPQGLVRLSYRVTVSISYKSLSFYCICTNYIKAYEVVRGSSKSPWSRTHLYSLFLLFPCVPVSYLKLCRFVEDKKESRTVRLSLHQNCSLFTHRLVPLTRSSLSSITHLARLQRACSPLLPNSKHTCTTYTSVNFVPCSVYYPRHL